MNQIPDYNLQPEDLFECPRCSKETFLNGYCSSCHYDEEFEYQCENYDNREKLN